MANKKQNFSKLFTGKKSAGELINGWSESYSTLFEPNTKNLFKIHKVPKFKRRHLAL